MSYPITKLLLEVGERLPLKTAERWALFVYCFRASDEGNCALGYGQIAKQVVMDKANLRKTCLSLQNKKILAPKKTRGIIVSKDELKKYKNAKTPKEINNKWSKRKQQDPFKNPNARQMINEQDDHFLRNIVQKFIAKNLPTSGMLVFLRTWRRCCLCKLKPIDILKGIEHYLMNDSPSYDVHDKINDVYNQMLDIIWQARHRAQCPHIPEPKYDFEDFLAEYPKKPLNFFSFIDEWYKLIDGGKKPNQIIKALLLAKQTPNGLSHNANNSVQSPESWLRNKAEKFMATNTPARKKPSAVLQAWESANNK